MIVIRKFLTLILGVPLLERLPLEIIERILTLAMRSSNYNWDSHVLQTYNSSRNVCRFWRIVRDSERVRSMLPRVYIPYEKALPSNLKGAKITVNVQRLIKNVDSSFGLINIVIKGDTKSQKLVHYLVGALSSSVWLVLS